VPTPPVRYYSGSSTQSNQPAPLEYNHWKPLHEERNPTPEWFKKWEDAIPCGTCKTNYRNLRIEPRFGDEWFPFTWELHNLVSEHVGNPIQSLDDAKACWLSEAPRRNPRLVLTIAVGRQFSKLLKLTRPLMEAYANRCGADFLALTNQQFDQWQREKFRVFDFAQQYDQTLFVDADVVIRDTCPDLFKEYAGVDVAMHDDYGYITYPHDPTWAAPDHDAVMRSQELSTKWNGKMWNSGLVLTSRRAAEIWKPPPHRLPSTEVSEQWWVQHQAESFIVVDLPSELNWQWWFPSFGSRVDAAHVVHVSGKCDKLTELRKYSASCTKNAPARKESA
jgi:hypothetical protein